MWGLRFLSIAILATALIMVLEEDIGFGVGWGLPCAWAAAWSALTIFFVKGELKKERAAWREKDPSSVDRAVALSKQSRSSYWMQLASNKYHGVDVSPKACPDDANVVPDTLG